MDAEDLNHFEALLKAKRAALLRQLERIEKTSMKSERGDLSSDVASPDYHTVDEASDDAERERAFLFASREGRYLHHLEEALDRIARGVFGLCRTCGKPISRDRLEAVPHASLCILCKSKEEKSRSKDAGALTPERTEDELLF